MKKYLLLAFGLLSIGFLSAQGFTISPNDSMVQQFPVGDAVELQINLKNETQSDMQIGWRILNAAKPAGWLIQVCDDSTCHNDNNLAISLSKILAPQGRTFVKARFIADNNSGQAHVVVRTWVVGDSANTTVDLFFMAYNELVSAPDAQSLSEFQARAYWRGDELHFVPKQGRLAAGTLELFDLSGKRIIQSEISSQSSGWQATLPGLSPGIYLLRYGTSKGYGVQKVVRTNSY